MAEEQAVQAAPVPARATSAPATPANKPAVAASPAAPAGVATAAAAALAGAGGALAAQYKNLTDKLYEKRMVAALDVEALVRDLAAKREEEQLTMVLRCLGEDLVGNPQANFKKGGMIALAAAAIALGPETKKYLDYLVPPILACFYDPDARVRYYAVEAVFNIAKVAVENVLIYFNELFDGCCKLVADNDTSVQKAAVLLDRQLKDIVTQSCTCDLKRFVPLLRERILTNNPLVKHFIIAWLSVLDSVPNIELVKYLPEYLWGLFDFLHASRDGSTSDQDSVVSETTAVLGELQKELSGGRDVQYFAIIKVVAHFAGCEDELTKQTALQWISTLLDIAPHEILPCADLLVAVIYNLRSSSKEIEGIAGAANAKLQAIVSQSTTSPPVNEYIANFLKLVGSRSPETRLAVLQWLALLHDKYPQCVAEHVNDIFHAIATTLSDPSDDVVQSGLTVMAKLSNNESYFQRLMRGLVNLFREDRALLRARASFIVRHLVRLMPPDVVYTSLARILEDEKDLAFAGECVQTLNLIMLTSRECAGLRRQLQRSPACAASRALFEVLYRSWCHSPASVFSLCLLCQAYTHASQLLVSFANLEITVSFLMELDQLVQLIESPVFVHLRLQLLEPQNNPCLLKCMYGLLMLLPQSSAFDLIKNRLNSVAKFELLALRAAAYGACDVLGCR
eukprot:TRINITY_DN174_c0_g1_i1.p1 TRINITY_DN174_c0_g1~~TRINITY_DN174_c0_g1_i1.p1  ORF type:complete len:688 (-),score=195.92 TRINITY_DN174_c0_g1_i1:1365-3407(-)